MPGNTDPDGTKHRTITLVEAYVAKDATAVAEAVDAIDTEERVTASISELKVLASFLTRRVQDTGVAWQPADAREAVARAVADLLEPEVELAVVSTWEAYSVGERAAAEHFTQGDPLVFAHMLAAFTAAIGQAVYTPTELMATLRMASGLAE
ncbi:hypothetical protein RIF23_12680 [Lipingzhangella sp. LS1_29]|uniref:Uncharacterized protein n=1 Tax=Lipingzhangella rawalii TaxID=2055835 RepID=A0ABU2H771_9ACTN|nr:hypothetical protein [Lipingzhangella rawalii]MDS1271150.1 hypothetical protein [Lipingzhangella rawalii]